MGSPLFAGQLRLWSFSVASSRHLLLLFAGAACFAPWRKGDGGKGVKPKNGLPRKKIWPCDHVAMSRCVHIWAYGLGLRHVIL